MVSYDFKVKTAIHPLFNRTIFHLILFFILYDVLNHIHLMLTLITLYKDETYNSIILIFKNKNAFCREYISLHHRLKL